MRIIKLNATHSTNDYLRSLSSTMNCDDFTVVTTKKQTKGKGQMGSSWTSVEGKNLTFSVFKRDLNLPLENHFILSVITSLAIHKALQTYKLKGLAVKWPNDILAENTKLCGVLIENVIKHGKIDSSIIGIGLNVNQTDFDQLPKASSLKKLTGIHYDLDELLASILKNLEFYFDVYAEKGDEILFELYNSVLYRKEKPSTFKTAEGIMCVGIIKKVMHSGKLEILFEDDEIRHFRLKEIQLLY